jgi:hypothetical protein
MDIRDKYCRDAVISDLTMAFKSNGFSLLQFISVLLLMLRGLINYREVLKPAFAVKVLIGFVTNK